MPNCKTFLVTEAERKPVRRRARFQQHRAASCHQVFLSRKARCRRNFTPFDRNIRGTCIIACHRQKWVAQCKRGDFSSSDASLPGRPKTPRTPEIIDQIHELILEDQQISARSIAEQLGISRERVGSIIHEDFDMRKLSAMWVPKCLKANKNVKGASSLSNFWNFFGAIQMVFFRDW